MYFWLIYPLLIDSPRGYFLPAVSGSQVACKTLMEMLANSQTCDFFSGPHGAVLRVFVTVSFHNTALMNDWRKTLKLWMLLGLCEDVYYPDVTGLPTRWSPQFSVTRTQRIDHSTDVLTVWKCADGLRIRVEKPAGVFSSVWCVWSPQALQDTRTKIIREQLNKHQPWPCECWDLRSATSLS